MVIACRGFLYTLTRIGSSAAKKPLTEVRGSCFGGRYRTRTCDLLHVKQMLYQLS